MQKRFILAFLFLSTLALVSVVQAGEIKPAGGSYPRSYLGGDINDLQPTITGLKTVWCDEFQGNDGQYFTDVRDNIQHQIDVLNSVVTNSLNLVRNGDFSQPLLSANTYEYTTNITNWLQSS